MSHENRNLMQAWKKATCTVTNCKRAWISTRPTLHGFESRAWRVRERTVDTYKHRQGGSCRLLSLPLMRSVAPGITACTLMYTLILQKKNEALSKRRQG